jgi:hypothetical protein
LSYITIEEFGRDSSGRAKKSRLVLEQLLRSAIGPKTYFEVQRGLKKLSFNKPEAIVDAYPRIVGSLFPEIKVECRETNMKGLPEKITIPKVWSGNELVLFIWKLKGK